MLRKFLKILEKIGEMRGKCHSHTRHTCHTYEICHNKCQQPNSEVWKISHDFKKFPMNTKMFPRYDLYTIGRSPCSKIIMFPGYSHPEHYNVSGNSQAWGIVMSFGSYSLQSDPLCHDHI